MHHEKLREQPRVPTISRFVEAYTPDESKIITSFQN
jgi:hypothetical protein